MTAVECPDCLGVGHLHTSLGAFACATCAPDDAVTFRLSDSYFDTPALTLTCAPRDLEGRLLALSVTEAFGLTPGALHTLTARATAEGTATSCGLTLERV